MPAILEFFPEEVVELNKEVQNHPLLLAALSDIQSAMGGHIDMEHAIGCVAAYCNVVLDGYYDEGDLKALIHLLTTRLKKKSAIIIH